MLDFNATFPMRSNAPDADYTFGSARNRSAEGADDGTLWTPDVLNDWLGFQCALVGATSITPSGAPDTANASDMLDGLVQLVADNRYAPEQYVDIAVGPAVELEADVIGKTVRGEGAGAIAQIPSGLGLTVGDFFYIRSDFAAFALTAGGGVTINQPDGPLGAYAVGDTYKVVYQGAETYSQYSQNKNAFTLFYDNTTSGLTSETVNDAIDEVFSEALHTDGSNSMEGRTRLHENLAAFSTATVVDFFETDATGIPTGPPMLTFSSGALSGRTSGGPNYFEFTDSAFKYYSPTALTRFSVEEVAGENLLRAFHVNGDTMFQTDADMLQWISDVDNANLTASKSALTYREGSVSNNLVLSASNAAFTVRSDVVELRDSAGVVIADLAEGASTFNSTLQAHNHTSGLPEDVLTSGDLPEAPAVTDYLPVQVYAADAFGVGQGAIVLPTTLGSSISIGSTGSGADIETAELDDLPAEAVELDVEFQATVSNSGANVARFEVRVRPPGVAWSKTRLSMPVPPGAVNTNCAAQISVPFNGGGPVFFEYEISAVTNVSITTGSVRAVNFKANLS